MNYFKILHRTTICILLVSGLMSCHEEPDFLGDNTTSLGNFPKIYMNPLTPDQDSYKPGEVISTTLEFFSTSDIQEIRIYSEIDDGEKKLENTFPYRPAFSEVKSQDTLVISYTVPELQESARITITAEIVNVNTLTDEASQSFDVILDCPPGSIAGTYLATTVVTTPFDGTYDNTGDPYEVTITDLGNDQYAITDITGGLYGEFYADLYGVSDLPATISRNECQVSAVDVPEDPVFEAAFGINLLNATGVIGVNVSGELTIDFSNEAGDTGTSQLIKQ